MTRGFFIAKAQQCFTRYLLRDRTLILLSIVFLVGVFGVIAELQMTGLPVRSVQDDGETWLLSGKKLNINEATLEDLIHVPHMSRRIATELLSLRQERKHFRKVDELIDVKGIGPKTLEKISPFLSVAEH